MPPVKRDDMPARLARIRRLIADLETECGRAAELRERFEELQQQIDALRPLPVPPKKAS